MVIRPPLRREGALTKGTSSPSAESPAKPLASTSYDFEKMSVSVCRNEDARFDEF